LREESGVQGVLLYCSLGGKSLKGYAELHRRCRLSQQGVAVAGVNEAYGKRGVYQHA